MLLVVEWFVHHVFLQKVSRHVVHSVLRFIGNFLIRAWTVANNPHACHYGLLKLFVLLGLSKIRRVVNVVSLLMIIISRRFLWSARPLISFQLIVSSRLLHPTIPLSSDIMMSSYLLNIVLLRPFASLIWWLILISIVLYQVVAFCFILSYGLYFFVFLGLSFHENFFVWRNLLSNVFTGLWIVMRQGNVCWGVVWFAVLGGLWGFGQSSDYFSAWDLVFYDVIWLYTSWLICSCWGIWVFISLNVSVRLEVFVRLNIFIWFLSLIYNVNSSILTIRYTILVRNWLFIDFAVIYIFISWLTTNHSIVFN